jgi:hypothetical protein
MLLHKFSLIVFKELETNEPKAGISFQMTIVIKTRAITKITRFIILISNPFIMAPSRTTFLIFFFQQDKIKLLPIKPTK